MFLTIQLAIICIAASCLSGAFFWLFRRKHSMVKALRFRIAAIQQSKEEFESRLLSLEEHAIDYLLSVGAEGSREITQMRAFLPKVEALITEAQSLIASDDFLALDEASALLSYAYHRLPDGKEELAIARFPQPDWEQQFEDTLQSVGAKVSSASVQAESLNLKKKRPKHLSTISSLYQIGIRSVINQIRAKEAPVRSLLTKKELPRSET